MKDHIKRNHLSIIVLTLLWTLIFPARTIQAQLAVEQSQDSLVPVSSGGGIYRRNAYKIRSKHYRIVFPSPPATSKDEYVFSVSIGKNGEFSYHATCPTSGTSLGMGILLGSATFADNNVKLPKACIEVQRATLDIIRLKQGRDAADTLGKSYKIVLEKAIFLRGLRALAYTETQINGLLNQQRGLNRFLPNKADLSSFLTRAQKKETEDQIEILNEDLNRLRSIIISTGHDYKGLVEKISHDSNPLPDSNEEDSSREKSKDLEAHDKSSIPD